MQSNQMTSHKSTVSPVTSSLEKSTGNGEAPQVHKVVSPTPQASCASVGSMKIRVCLSDGTSYQMTHTVDRREWMLYRTLNSYSKKYEGRRKLLIRSLIRQWWPTFNLKTNPPVYYQVELLTSPE